ncbi:MAG: response regulator [bacterium]
MNSHPKGTLLLIEDDAQFQENLAVVFRIAGYETLFANNAQEGFAALQSHSVDMIVLDYRLPGMSGMQFFETLLSEDRYRTASIIPVVVITGYPILFEEKTRFMRMGAKALITKGTGFKDLVKIIDQEVEAYKAVTSFNTIPSREFSLPEYLCYIEKQIILRAMIKNPACSQDSIAKELGIPRSTLSRKLGEYKLRLR